MSVLTTKMTNSISPKVNFFIREEKCTPVEFFKKFNYTAKSKGVSDWCSLLSASLALSNDEKLVELEQKYNNGHYTRAIDDYFLSKQSSCVLNKEKVCQTCCDVSYPRFVYLKFFHILPDRKSTRLNSSH